MEQIIACGQIISSI